jgi:hypothetical protein
MTPPGWSCSEYDKARAGVEEAVRRHIKDWAALVRLTQTDGRFPKFREDVTDALHACMRAHIAEKYRRHKRYSHLSRDFDAAARAATSTAKGLRNLAVVLKRLPPMHHDPAFRLMHDPHATACELDGLAQMARRYADECKSADRGGPSTMRAFKVLAVGLIHAYRGATKKRGTGRSAREGKLLDLVEAVLPTARTIAMNVTGKPLAAPGDVGDYLHRVASRLRGA